MHGKRGGDDGKGKTRGRGGGGGALPLPIVHHALAIF